MWAKYRPTNSPTIQLKIGIKDLGNGFYCGLNFFFETYCGLNSENCYKHHLILLHVLPSTRKSEMEELRKI